MCRSLRLRYLWRVRKVIEMAECKHNIDEICTNADCPLVADYCPVPDTPDVCQWEDRSENDE